jgi:endonuclease/exonuclease/phosphatase family metal-dependent hydrolase
MTDPTDYLPDPYATRIRRLRVATLNIFAHGGGWPDRLPVLREGFRDLRPDLIALQEVVHNDADDQAAEILGDRYHVVHQTRGKIDDNGIAIASRWPIRRMQEVDLEVTTRAMDLPTFALVAEIDLPEPFGPVVFATYSNEYRPAFEIDRERQAVAMARVLEPFVDEERRHVVVAGDMNAEPDAASMRFWTGRQSLAETSVCYRDAWESAHPGERGETFAPDNPLMAEANWDWPFRQIDHILVRCSTSAPATASSTGPSAASGAAITTA